MFNKWVKNFGLWVGMIVFLFAALIFWKSLALEYYGPYGPGPGLLPRWLSGILGILTLVYIVTVITKEVITVKEVFPKGKILLRIVSVVVSIILFIIISPFVGFNIALTITLLICLLPEFKWYTSFGISIVITVVLFLVFGYFFQIPLPANAWGF